MALGNGSAQKPAANEVLLVTSGDLRQSANQVCWPAQRDMEEKLTAAFAQKGYKLVRAHPYVEEVKHGFIWSQRMGMDVFMKIHPEAKLVFATAAWQYSHHVLPGLRSHRGPILTAANWSGQWPGLVGLLNLNGSLIKAGKPFSSIWSKDFTDAHFQNALDEWLRDGKITHDLSHVHTLDRSRISAPSAQLGAELAANLKLRKAIMGIFDEGCMGMYNAIIDDELLNPAGVFKERLSQSALVAKMRTVTDAEARAVYDWLVAKGVKFAFGMDPATELSLDQVLDQCKMYVAAVRIAKEFGCDAIGIQYQQGLKDMAPASDLAEGMLNNTDRPPVYAEGTRDELYAGGPLVHFNEVDECAGFDSLVTNLCWKALGLDPSTTLHDVRWGEHYKGDGNGSGKIDDFVWLLQISGAAPATTLWAVTRAPSASASPLCTSRSAVVRSRGSASPAKSSGAASLSRAARCIATLAVARW
ncbi:MAG: fucose isomerase [Terracidiphilus sp.]